MKKKELYKRVVQEKVGWAYPDLKWLTDKEITAANQNRDKLLQSLSEGVNYSFKQSKIHTGKLSPGCLICGKGPWSCLFINALCTANCFYCPQDRKIKEEKAPYDDIMFDNPEDYVDYLKKFAIKGVGFSGGEPLLIFDKLLLYINEIRKEFGKGIYIWIYTNGDLVNKDKVEKLKRSGIDEIRFNISASDYNLSPVKLATKIMNTVTVEIPSIPKDYEIVKRCLPKLQKMGVKYLNIHQLCTTEWNYKNYIKRGYTFLHRPSIPVFESEIAALKLIRHALDEKIKLPINYCSCVYKERFHEKGAAGLRGRLVKSDFEELTNLNHIRQLSVQGTTVNINKIVKILYKNRCQQRLWSLNNKGEIYIHSSLLKYIDFNKHILTISYYRPVLTETPNPDGLCNEIKLNSVRRIYIRKSMLTQKILSNPASVATFQKLFIENLPERHALDYFYKNYRLNTKENVAEIKKELEILMALKDWEWLEEGFPAVY